MAIRSIRGIATDFTTRSDDGGQTLDPLSSIAAATKEAQMLYELTQDLGNSLSLQEALAFVGVRLKRLIPYETITTYIRRGDDAQLALPELTLGMIPGSGGASRLVKMIGVARAKDVVMRGRRVPAAEAFTRGDSCARSCRATGSAPPSRGWPTSSRPGPRSPCARPSACRRRPGCPAVVCDGVGGPGLRPVARLARLRRGRRGVRGEAEAAVPGTGERDGALRGRIGLLVAVALAGA